MVELWDIYKFAFNPLNYYEAGTAKLFEKCSNYKPKIESLKVAMKHRLSVYKCL